MYLFDGVMGGGGGGAGKDFLEAWPNGYLSGPNRVLSEQK